MALIQQYLPENNSLLRRPAPVGIEKMSFFQDLLKKADPNLEKPPGLRRRQLPKRVLETEKLFQSSRDRRQAVTLPRMKFLDEHAA
jgi:hypothetical protein